MTAIRCGSIGFWRQAATSLVFAAVLSLSAFSPFLARVSDTSVEDRPRPIYAEDSNDAWNRTFYYLFSRLVNVRYSGEFPEAAPFGQLDSVFRSPATEHIGKSLGLFQRFEPGDRAIDPLYPSQLSSTGPQQVLSDPLYGELVRALREAQRDNVTRKALARALMQSDLWSAFDILHSQSPSQFDERKTVLMEQLAHLVERLALTRAEIRALPDNYTLSIGRFGLPDLFGRDSAWVEVEWFPTREHDMAAGFRRVSRVFVKPAKQFGESRYSLDALRSSLGENSLVALDGVAIIIQQLLIDSHGTVLPTRLTTKVQLRLFPRSSDGHSMGTQVRQYEFSRRLMVSQPLSGGFIEEDDSAPSCLPMAINDYDFCSSQYTHDGVDTPLVVKLRTRCAFCHGTDLSKVLTFAKRNDSNTAYPPVMQLNPLANEAADYVVVRKLQRQDWKSLQRYLSRSPSTIHQNRH